MFLRLDRLYDEKHFAVTLLLLLFREKLQDF